MVEEAKIAFNDHKETQDQLAILFANDMIGSLEARLEVAEENMKALEEQEATLLEGMERLGWPCRLVELPEYYHRLVNSYEERRK